MCFFPKRNKLRGFWLKPMNIYHIRESLETVAIYLTFPWPGEGDEVKTVGVIYVYIRNHQMCHRYCLNQFMIMIENDHILAVGKMKETVNFLRIYCFSSYYEINYEFTTYCSLLGTTRVSSTWPPLKGYFRRDRVLYKHMVSLFVRLCIFIQ